MKTNILTTLIGKTAAIAFLMDSLMALKENTRLTMVQLLIMITIAMGDHQIDIRILIILTIVAATNIFLIAREMGPIRVPITSTAHHPLTFKGEAGRIRCTVGVVLFPGNIRIEIRMGQRDVVHLHHATIDENTEIDRTGRHIQNQKETMDEI